MPKFLVIVREYRDLEYVVEAEDEEAARDAASELFTEDNCVFDGGTDIRIEGITPYESEEEE